MVTPVPVSARLAGYRRRDLLSAHARRIDSAETKGELNATEAALARHVVDWQVEQRERLRQAETAAQAAQDALTKERIAREAGFASYRPSTAAEMEMLSLWRQRR